MNCAQSHLMDNSVLLLDHKNEAFLRHESATTGAQKRTWRTLTVVFTFTVLFGVFFIWVHVRASHFEHNGVSTVAKVVSKVWVEGPDSSSCEITYEFHTEKGVICTGFTSSERDCKYVGPSLNIVYPRSDPAKSRVRRSAGQIFAPVVLEVLLLMGVHYCYLKYKLASLHAKGVVIRGIISNLSRVGQDLTVSYTFSNPIGRQVKAVAEGAVQRSNLKKLSTFIASGNAGEMDMADFAAVHCVAVLYLGEGVYSLL